MNNISEIQIQILALDKLHIHVPAKHEVIWGQRSIGVKFHDHLSYGFHAPRGKFSKYFMARVSNFNFSIDKKLDDLYWATRKP